MTMNPAPTTWRVTSVLVDETWVTATLVRTDWRRDLDPDWDPESGQQPETEPAEPGTPGAFWQQEGTRFDLTLPRSEAMYFDVGRQYVLALTEIVDAPVTEYEPA